MHDSLISYIHDVPDFPQPGILFRDITPLLRSPLAFQTAIQQLAAPFREQRIQVVAAAESRGFLFGAPLALELGAGFVPIRKPGKLPRATESRQYDLEYGQDQLQIHRDAIHPGERVLLVDDVLATGGTMKACAELVQSRGGLIVSCAFLIELHLLHGREKLAPHKILSLIEYA